MRYMLWIYVWWYLPVYHIYGHTLYMCEKYIYITSCLHILSYIRFVYSGPLGSCFWAIWPAHVVYVLNLGIGIVHPVWICIFVFSWWSFCWLSLFLLFPRTPLHYAAASRHYQCLETLVACGTAINATDQWERSALHYAAASDLDRRWGAGRQITQSHLLLLYSWSRVVSKSKGDFLQILLLTIWWGEKGKMCSDETALLHTFSLVLHWQSG